MDNNSALQRFVQIPVDALSESALSGLVEEFASRDGTDYGSVEVTLDVKVRELRAALANGSCVIVFDEASSSCQIVTREMLLEQAADGA